MGTIQTLTTQVSTFISWFVVVVPLYQRAKCGDTPSSETTISPPRFPERKISFDEFEHVYNSDGVSTTVIRVGGVEGNNSVYWVRIDFWITLIPMGYREYRFGGVYRN